MNIYVYSLSQLMGLASHPQKDPSCMLWTQIHVRHGLFTVSKAVCQLYS